MDVAVCHNPILSQREFRGASLGHFSINWAFYLVMTWLPTFLVRAGGFSVSEMAGIAATIFGVYAVATAAAGAVSDRWIARGAAVTRVRKALLFTSGLGVAATIACCAYVEPRSTVWLLGAAGVFFGLSTPTGFAVTATLAGPRAAGRWAGAQNVAGQLAGMLAPLVTGIIVDRTGSYALAFAIAAALALVAALAWCLIIRQVAEVPWPKESRAANSVIG